MTKHEVIVKPTLKGFFKMVAIRPDGEERVLADWFPNLILDSGLNLMGTTNYTEGCQVGTNNTAPVNGDTALHSFLAGTTTKISRVESAQGAPPYYSKTITEYEFGTGVAAGNLSEVGVGPAGTGDLFSRALILDGGGSPTTITVLSDEILHVFYELRAYPPLVDGGGVVNISGTDYTIVSRAAAVTSWGGPHEMAGIHNGGGLEATAWQGPLGAITALPSGASSLALPGVGNQAYINNSLNRDMGAEWDITTGNLGGGIGAVSLNTTLGKYQFSFTPAIPKDALSQLDLVFRIAWSRHPL